MDLEDYVKGAIDDMDIESCVKNVIESFIGKEIKAEIKKQIRAQTEKHIEIRIKDEIELALDGKIETDNGWGKCKTYDNFDELFKTYFKKRLDSSYKMKTLIKKSVEAKVNKLFTASEQEIKNAVMAVLDRPDPIRR